MFVIKKSAIVLFAFILLCVASAVAIPTISPKPSFEHLVVIDAGHGGRDGGSVGIKSGVFEKDLNLQYAYTLKKMLESNGIGVILTRASDSGLYNEWDSNKKSSDMQQRESIIHSSNASLFVSIHMNSFALSSVRGAQAFYFLNNKPSEQFASVTQTALKKMVPYAKNTPKTVDFYLLKVSPIPSILIECGYLSNPEDDLLLQTKTHQEKLCYAIFCGIYAYLHMLA